MNTPNFNNKRTQARVKSALGMTLACLTEDKPREIGTRFIDKYYSGQSNVTGKWLRKTLLNVHDETFSFLTRSKCKTYTYNPEGVKLVRELLNEPPVYNSNSNLPVNAQTKAHARKLALDWANDTYDISNVEYTDKSNRLWHPIQNIPKETRKSYFYEQGYTAQYDIVCAAPSLLHQYSWRFSYGLVLETIDYYIDNRSDIRKKIANEVDLPVSNIKELINSFFAGAPLGVNENFACWTMCNQDEARIEFLKQHPFITDLRNDIKDMWEYLRSELPIEQKTCSNGVVRNVQMTGHNKWNLYFQLERQVLNAIRSYLDKNQLEYFLMHDAFVSNDLDEVVIDEIVTYVYESTGFMINLEQELTN